MSTPTMGDYVKLLLTLFEQFVQEQGKNESKQYDYSNVSLIVLVYLFCNAGSWRSLHNGAGLECIPRC